MNPLEMPALTQEQVEAVATLYRTTYNVRLRTRAQMVLLAVEQHLGVREIAAIVRECEGTVRCWLKRYTCARDRRTAGFLSGRSAGQGDPRPTRTSCCSSCGGGRGVWTCPIPPGRCNDWQMT